MCHLCLRRNFCIKYSSHFPHVASESFTNVKKYQHLYTFRVFFKLSFSPTYLKPKTELSANGNHESGPFREVRQQDSREGGGGRVSGTGEGGHWSSWWDWSPGSNSLRRQDWSKRRNVLTGTDVKRQDEEISQTGVLPALLFLIYSISAHYYDRNLINTIGRMRRMCVRYKSEALTLVKVELLVGRAVPQTFDVHKVAVDIWIIQCTEGHVCKRKGVSPPGLTLIYVLFWFPTCCLLFLDGHGQRRAVLHACGHNHLGGRHSDHRRGGGSWCRRGDGCLLHSFFGWLGGNWDSAVLIQLPLHCALNLSSARDDSIRTWLIMVIKTNDTLI